MLKVDSISLKVPLEKVEITTKEQPPTNQQIDWETGEINFEKRRYREKLGFGLNSFSTEKVRGTAEIGLSAKILGAEYFDGINQNNVKQVSENIKKVGVFKISEETLLGAEVLKLDTTENLRPEEIPVQRMIRSLHTGIVNTRYDAKGYGGAKATGVVFQAGAKSNSTRFLAYSKQDEMHRLSKLKSHSEFFNSLGADFYRLLEVARGVLRVELNLRDHKRIRERLDVEKELGIFQLATILESEQKPTFDVATDIFKPELQLDVWKGLEDVSFLESIKAKGFNTLVAEGGYDMKTIKALCLAHPKMTKQNFNNYKGEIQKALQRAKQITGNEHGSEDIRQFLTMLKEVA